MVLYFSDNKETERKRKGVFYEETLPENAVIFGSTTLKKYNGGPADYMKVGAKRYYIDEPVSERDVIGYIPVVAERYPSAPSEIIDPTENKYGYIQVKEGFPFLIYLLPIILLLILLVLIVRSVGGNGIFKKDVVLPDIKHELPAEITENKEMMKDPEKIQDPIQTPAPTKEPEKEEKNTPVAVLPMDPVVVPGNKVTAKPVSVITPTPMPSSEPAKMEEKSDDKENDVSTPTPTPTPPTETSHVHNYTVEEKEPTCTDLGYYKKYCKDCGYVVADHTCTAMGHTLEVTSVSNMTYPGGMDAEYKCKRCGETVTDNFDYTSGLYREDGSLLYTYDALEQLFDWNLSTTPVKEQMDAHTELSGGRILVLPSWEYLMEVAKESGETEAIYSKNGSMQSDGKYHLAFSNTVLTEVVLPDDTPYLGNWFIEANNIEKLELPDSITEYKGGIYSLKNLKYLKVSAGVPVINMHFTSCPKVETLIIPEGVTSIQGVNFPAFGGETANGMNVFLPNTLTSFGGCFNSSKIKYLYIPGSVTDLTDLNSITGLEEIVLGEGIEKIPIYFRTSGGLKKITIPSTMKEIGDGAFYGANLKEVIWGNCNVKLGSNVFEYCNDLKNLYIPDNTKEITSFLISGNSNMKTQSVVFPEEVDLFGRPSGPIIQIRNGNDSGIVGHVIMPSKINKFVTNSSSNIIWDTLEEIVLPGGDYSDIYGLFSGCNKLKEITFTSELTGMSKHFFTYIPSVTDIYYYGSEKSINTLIDEYNAIKTDSDPANLFGNATIHYMTGNPPTREELMKKYGIWDDYHEHVIDAPTEDDTEADTVSFNIDAIFPVVLNANVELAATEHTHTISIDEKAPTCTEDGYYKVTCSTCGEILADHTCHKLEHNMRMIDPDDNTTDIMVPKYKCDRCGYTESSNHEHIWTVKGYENMTYPDGGDEMSICTICLAKKNSHADPIPGLYAENGALMYGYDDLEDKFDWNLSTTPVKDIMDAHTELADGRILVLPSWQHLSKIATESGADCGLIRGDNGNTPCFTGSLLSEVILPDDCNEFGYWFCASNVTKIELPDSITSYGRYSISSASKLKYLKLSAGVTDLTGFGGVHSNPELETFVIPEGVEKLGNTTFTGNDKLKNVALPESLTDIGQNAFASTGIENLEIPSGVKEIKSLAGMHNLKNITLNKGLEIIDSGAFASLHKLEKINIPNTVTSIGGSIFSGLTNLQSVTLEDGLTTLGECMFASCMGIKEIKIPDSIKTIPDNTFTGASNLQLIILPNKLDSIGSNGLFSCGENAEELKIIMPTSITQWRNGVSMCSSKLKEIVLPGNTNYPQGFFSPGCNPSKVVITSAPTIIEERAFDNLHDADIYYYGSRESLQELNEKAGIDDVFYQTDNNNTVHFMIDTPPSREDQLNGIDYSSLIEDTGVTTLSVPATVSDVSSGDVRSVSDGNAN